MNDIKGIVRYKHIAAISGALSFFCLIFSLNQPILPTRILGFQTATMTYFSSILCFAFLVIAAYLCYKYDRSLYALDLNDKDLFEDSGQGNSEAAPSRYKRDKLRKKRKARKRKQKS
tara:strand:- start:6310 stop:6660 length:351 start_codon:yes stop_codon:yes gene_type:complete